MSKAISGMFKAVDNDLKCSAKTGSTRIVCPIQIGLDDDLYKIITKTDLFVRE